MTLLRSLLVRMAAVVVLCIAVTVGLVLLQGRQDLERATEASADRAAVRLQALYWQELVWRDGLDRSTLLPVPEWRTPETVAVVAPGVCIALIMTGEGRGRLCSGSPEVYPTAPAWFSRLENALFPPLPDATRDLDVRQRDPGTVAASADPEIAIRLAWLRIAPMLLFAGVTAGAVALLIAFVVTKALLPVAVITEGLRRLEAGERTHRVGRLGAFELASIAVAVDALASSLQEAEAARSDLTRRLFQVQEEERRALARDLHDEFGQCLAAVGAYAGSIGMGATDAAIIEEAGLISGIVTRMSGTLREALVRLRSQAVDELGLEAALRELASRWNGRRIDSGARTAARVLLELVGDLSRVPEPVAVQLYRIAQECLTNAARHGDASTVRLRVDAGPAIVRVSVDDDGRGDPASVGSANGHGVLGIRERIGALGGTFSVGRSARGLLVSATIPLRLPAGPAVCV